MKSKFFGFNAKLALTLLAVSGTMLTGCYESEGNDQPLPYTPPPAVYSIVGTVTDMVTGLPVSAEVKIGSASAPATAGAYSYTTETAGAHAITVSKTGYTDYSGSLTITALKPGQSATYMFNIALEPTDFSGLKITQSSSIDKGTSTTSYVAPDDVEVDYVNNNNTPMPLTFVITKDWGGKIMSDNLGVNTRSIDDLKVYIENYLIAMYGSMPVAENEDFNTNEFTYKFELAPQSSLKSVDAVTRYKEDTYTFTYNGVHYKIVVLVAYATEFSHAQYSNNIYHGHGHGHGHGSNLNAGGGIIDPIN